MCDSETYACIYQNLHFQILLQMMIGVVMAMQFGVQSSKAR